MPGPVDYRKGGGGDDPRGRARRVILTGAALAATGAIVIATTALTPYLALAAANKYVAAAGFVGACVGLTVMLNGALDWWRGK